VRFAGYCDGHRHGYCDRHTDRDAHPQPYGDRDRYSHRDFRTVCDTHIHPTRKRVSDGDRHADPDIRAGCAPDLSAVGAPRRIAYLFDRALVYQNGAT
jgi:hypothetical protein